MRWPERAGASLLTLEGVSLPKARRTKRLLSTGRDAAGATPHVHTRRPCTHAGGCTSVYPLRTAKQLFTLLRALAKESGLTQSEVAQRLGVTQPTYSILERNAETVGVDRLPKMLAILGFELVP